MYHFQVLRFASLGHCGGGGQSPLQLPAVDNEHRNDDGDDEGGNDHDADAETRRGKNAASCGVEASEIQNLPLLFRWTVVVACKGFCWLHLF